MAPILDDRKKKACSLHAMRIRARKFYIAAGQTSMEIEWCGTGTCVGTGNYVWITSTKKYPMRSQASDLTHDLTARCRTHLPKVLGPIWRCTIINNWEIFFASVIQYNEPARSLIWYYKRCPRTPVIILPHGTINLFSRHTIYDFFLVALQKFGKSRARCIFFFKDADPNYSIYINKKKYNT